MGSERPAWMIGLRRSITSLMPVILCVGLVAWGFAAWGTGILRGSFDHDEFEHTHVIWLIAQGHRPFYDFFECHPPLLWYALALVLRLTGERYAVLFVFRFLTALGHVAFFVALARNVALSFDRLEVKRTSYAEFARMAVLGLAVIAAHPAILGYLLEFRLDAWPNALLLFAIYRYRAARRDPLRSSAELGFLAAVAIACSPKLLMFGAAFIGFDLLRGGDPRARRVAGLAAGGAAAIACLLGFLFAVGLDPRVVFRLSITYHAQLNQHAGFGHGLAQSVWGQRALLAIVVASVVACVAQLRARLLSHPFESATIVFLGAQLVFASVPFKQYYGPWFLMAAALVPYLELAVVRVTALRLLLVAAALVYGTANVVDFQRHSQKAAAALQIAQRQQLLDLVPRDGAVVVSMERHPLFRADTLYHISSSSAPSGWGTNRIMTEMNFQPFSSRFSSEFYSREMEERPPDLIVSRGWFMPEQQQAIDAFLARHGAAYRRFEGPLGPTYVREAAPKLR